MAYEPEVKRPEKMGMPDYLQFAEDQLLFLS